MKHLIVYKGRDISTEQMKEFFFLPFQLQQPAKEIFFYSDILKRLHFSIAFKKLLIISFSPRPQVYCLGPPTYTV